MGMKDNLKRIRKAKGLTQSELSQKTGISFSMISKLESGEQKNPSLDTINAIAAALDVEPFQLLTDLDLIKIEPVILQVQKELDDLQSRPVEQVHRTIHDLLLSKAGTEYFGINHNAISPEELERVEDVIMKFIAFQFNEYKDKSSIYDS